MTDDEIIEHYWQRDKSAISETSEQYGAYCYHIANNILHNKEDAEECVNDTWLRAWSSIPPNRPTHLRLFLAKITRNLAFNRQKAKKTAKRGGGEIDAVLNELSECLADSTDAESAFSASELEKSINQFVGALPERDCNIFVRRYFFTEPISAIAARYALKKNNVMVILSRTRQKLREHLKQEGFTV